MLTNNGKRVFHTTYEETLYKVEKRDGVKVYVPVCDENDKFTCKRKREADLEEFKVVLREHNVKAEQDSIWYLTKSAFYVALVIFVFLFIMRATQ